MKFYDVVIRWNDNKELEDAIIAKVTNSVEHRLLDTSDYKDLFEDTGYTDEDVIYILDIDEPNPLAGQEFDDFTIVSVCGGDQKLSDVTTASASNSEVYVLKAYDKDADVWTDLLITPDRNQAMELGATIVNNFEINRSKNHEPIDWFDIFKRKKTNKGIEEIRICFLNNVPGSKWDYSVNETSEPIATSVTEPINADGKPIKIDSFVSKCIKAMASKRYTQDRVLTKTIDNIKPDGWKKDDDYLQTSVFVLRDMEDHNKVYVLYPTHWYCGDDIKDAPEVICENSFDSLKAAIIKVIQTVTNKEYRDNLFKIGFRSE